MFLSKAFIALISSVHFALGAPSDAAIGTTVKLDYGTFVGASNTATGIVSFRGVPFADPPLGNLRWRPPVTPPSKQLGTVSATQFGKACISTTQTSVGSNSEDCLFGNVFLPNNTKTTDKLPVMVWFHGGGFQGGDSHTDPTLLLQTSAKPFIFVSFEYRLGQFGFLGGSQIGQDRGLNAGLLDQRAGLQWVKRYISQFGGDPNRVTIWGQSAGAGSTMFQLIANGGNNQGLFQAAMGDSPSLSFTPSFDGTYVEGIYEQFASFAGCPKNAQTLSCLRSKSSDVLTAAGSKTLGARLDTLFVFAPILDNNFITQRPVEAFKAGNFARVPVFFGSNTNEGNNWSAGLKDPAANTSEPNANEQTVTTFFQGQWATVTDAELAEAEKMYPLASFSNSVSAQGARMYGEARYICSAAMITGAGARKKVAGGRSYQYHYNNPHLGSDHAAELGGIFGPSSSANADDLALFKTMREFWSSFVTDGKPTSKSATWDPVTADSGSPRILLQPGAVAMESLTGDFIDRCDFWHGISGDMQT
ncbi:alpha/beta-hydrolase [Panaeolus papilionaceus]|nr:alpha/beta-hydrolase [Panaeolus papilionaceus]